MFGRTHNAEAKKQRRSERASGQPVERLEDRRYLGMVMPVGGFDGGSEIDEQAAVGSFDGTGASSKTAPGSIADLWHNSEQPITIRYDFRGLNGEANEITARQMALAEQVFAEWQRATGGRVQFLRDTNADASQIVNVGVGSLDSLGHETAQGGTLGLGGSVLNTSSGQPEIQGIIWLDRSENWDNTIGNGDPAGTVDFFTVAAHEAGHVLGLADTLQHVTDEIMGGTYDGESSTQAIDRALQQAMFLPLTEGGANGLPVSPLVDIAAQQLSANEVTQTLDFASQVSDTNDAIIAIVDRNGRILGVRVEQEVLDNFAGDPAGLVFAIDGAVAKARTAAFFSNGDPNNTDAYSPNGTLAPLTSRLVRFVSQSTVTEREVESNPNITDPNSTVRGPGFVAPIGLGAHFPPEVANTPPVDLFGIEHTNRDSIFHPGDDGIKGTADDFTLRGRFNIDPTFVPAGQTLFAPESYGTQAGITAGATDPSDWQSRGIATLPGGVPLYRDSNGDGIGETLIGGIGVFFPGPDGFATHEQGFIPGIGQTETQRTNASRVLEAEFIAVMAAGGSNLANNEVGGFKPTNHPVPTLDVPFGRLDLVGIQLQVIGPVAGTKGLLQLRDFAQQNIRAGAASGADQQINAGGDLAQAGLVVPEGMLVTPHASTVDPELTAERVNQLIFDAVEAAKNVRAAVRLDAGDASPGVRTRMVIAVTDTSGEVLGLFRMKDATVFSIDVAVAKARNTSYYADPNALQPIDQINGVPAGTAFTNRTFRFVSEPRFPDGIDGTPAGPFSIMNNPSINPRTGENLGAPAAASTFTSVLGFDAFNPQTNFRDPGDPGVVAGSVPAVGTTNKANQNGIVFFPGSTPLYENGNNLIGGYGISGDGVDQDDVVTFLGARNFLPDGQQVLFADQTFVRGVRLPYVKFLRNPFG
ncbi:matrixin family metalloprotease [Stratiformator vulcanicus]|uniref:Matrixin n=1 Tax=Stratiformator vulcanicus TaxID=2527980 RepID=A0A517QXV6_9PLAN|nr:matrixin family metalloprotease [Stratiformator vulcanicus]QDT36410.1 Matrixin [Stratiformator vulcanicus]